MKDPDDIIEVTAGHDAYAAVRAAERAVRFAKKAVFRAKCRLLDAKDARTLAWNRLEAKLDAHDMEANERAAEKRVEDLNKRPDYLRACGRDFARDELKHDAGPSRGPS